jgi:hypothetical protein
MAVYRVTSIQRGGPTGETDRIAKVWCHKDGRTALGQQHEWTVAEVDARDEKDHKFYTFGLSSLRSAGVEPFDEVVSGQTVRSLRSTLDAIPDNDLENLPLVKKTLQGSTKLGVGGQD